MYSIKINIYTVRMHFGNLCKKNSYSRFSCKPLKKLFCNISFSNEIEATLSRLKKLEKDLTVKEKQLREVWADQ